jgi:hypothetical protein
LVRGESARRTSEEVARKLIEEDQEGERPFGRLVVARELAAGRALMLGQEACPDLLVESLVLGPPFIVPGLPPEHDHIAGGRQSMRG